MEFEKKKNTPVTFAGKRIDKIVRKIIIKVIIYIYIMDKVQFINGGRVAARNSSPEI